jgi:hypothetical protein
VDKPDSGIDVRIEMEADPMTDEENVETPEEEDDDYPAAVTDPTELPSMEPDKGSDGNDQEAAELPPLDDEIENGEEEGNGEEA